MLNSRLLPSFEMVFAARDGTPRRGTILGHSREGRPIEGFTLGTGLLKISLIGGCHADEPVGPWLLRRVVAALSALPGNHPALTEATWWILPHLNPDGAARNASWQREEDPQLDLASYLAHAVRENPGDDLEFGFPRSDDDTEARPEARAALNWWRSSGGPFHLHVSLHSLSFGAGPWFLLDAGWVDRTRALRTHLESAATRAGHVLHDVERRGEKGFHRIERGFATCPTSRAMADHFLALGDPETARQFRPSSMETVKSLGGDPLTLVSEVPFFVTPGVGDHLGPPDPVALDWKRKIDAWRLQLGRGQRPEKIKACSSSGCLAAIPLSVQMALQWELVAAGLDAVMAGKTPGDRGPSPVD